MAPRFDFERSSLELAVADLLEPRLLQSLGFAQRGGYERLWLGQALHGRYQEQAIAADPTYEREVHLAVSFIHRGWDIRLQGRMDGLRRDSAGRRVVEEIKSIRESGSLSLAARELYERQAALYAWMLRQRDGGEVGAELILISVAGEILERYELELDFSVLELAIERRLNALLGTAESERMARSSRREAAARLRFPFSEMRPGQETILTAVEAALEHGEHLLLQAPTGIGKTVSALFPALRYTLARDKRLFVLTAKTLQQDMAMKVLSLLNDEGAFRSLRLRAKAKMCANGEVICHEDYCPYAREYYAKLSSSHLLERLLADHPTLEPELVLAAAKANEVCPFEVSLELSRLVQVTVGDYNYAFDPYVALTEFHPEADLSDVVLVIDEIHNLVDRGRGYYSPSLSAAAARKVQDAFQWSASEVGHRISDLAERMAILIETTVNDALAEQGLSTSPDERGGRDRPSRELAAEAPLPDDDLWTLRPAFDDAFVDYLEYQRETRTYRAEDPFVDLYFEFLRFLSGLGVSDASFSHLVQRTPEDHRLKILCRDPSRFLNGIFRRVHAVIGLSATLSPSEFYRDILGLEAGRTATVTVPSPFPPEKRLVVIDPSVATSYRERSDHYEGIASRLGELADATPGNCLALFPSYEFLAEIATRLRTSGKRVLIQRRADSDREREEILEHLRSSWLGDVLLLAVAGGVFAEGVDYPGDMLRAVAVVGPCLPALSLEQRLLREYYDERFERGFEYAFVVPGMTRVVQAAGRLIRSPEDSGVIALLDRRFLESPYRHHLPEEWIPEDGLRGVTGNAARAARGFFAGR